MGSGGAGLPSGGGGQGEEAMGLAGPCWSETGPWLPVIAASWVWFPADGVGGIGVFLLSNASFWEKLPCGKRYRFGCAQNEG